MNSRIETFSGLYVDPLNMKKEDIRIVDIAHALSMQCRFSGHTSNHYSVAEHSVHVSTRLGNDALGLIGLLHDASEAYLVDIPAPIKHLPEMGAYRQWEERLQNTIYLTYLGRLPTEAEHEKLKTVDIGMRKLEQAEFMKPHPEIKLSWLGGPPAWFSYNDKRSFLDRFAELI